MNTEVRKAVTVTITVDEKQIMKAGADAKRETPFRSADDALMETVREALSDQDGLKIGSISVRPLADGEGDLGEEALRRERGEVGEAARRRAGQYGPQPPRSDQDRALHGEDERVRRDNEERAIQAGGPGATHVSGKEPQPKDPRDDETDAERTGRERREEKDAKAQTKKG